MKIETIGKLRGNIIKARGWSEVELKSVVDKDNKIVFSGIHLNGAFTGEADREGWVLELHLCSFGLTQAEKKEGIKLLLESSGYKFEHPTLILEGKEGWFVILTPHRPPHQAIVHWDGKQPDFFSTIPELLLNS